MVFRVGVRRTRFVSVPLCLHLSRLELIEAALAAPPAVTHLPRAPSFDHFVIIRRPPSSRRGEALWERVEAGSGSLGAASSESAAGSVRGAVGSGPADVEPAAVSAVAWSCGCVVGFGWL